MRITDYNKYNVSKKEDRTADNVVFASQKEMRRYQELKLLEKAGEIINLRLQPRFLLQNGFTDKMLKKHRPIYYVADFSYFDRKHSWEEVVEDCKGHKTEIYKLKKKLFLKQHKVWFFET